MCVLVPPDSRKEKPQDGKVVKWFSRTTKRAKEAARKAFDQSKLADLFDGMEDEK